MGPNSLRSWRARRDNDSSFPRSHRHKRKLHRHHLRSYEAAGNWTMPASNPRYPDGRVAINHRLHLFGKDLLSANVNHAFASASEVIAITGTLQQIPGVDKSIAVTERRF